MNPGTYDPIASAIARYAHLLTDDQLVALTLSCMELTRER